MLWRGGFLPVRGARCVGWKEEPQGCRCGSLRETPEHLFLECEEMEELRRGWLGDVGKSGATDVPDG